MSIEKIQQDYYDASGQTSDRVRQLGFAGIAIVWIFKQGSGLDTSLPSSLVLPSICLVGTLALDLLHYVVSTAIWGIYQWVLEKKGKEPDPDKGHKRWLVRPIFYLFCAKVLGIIVSYIFLLAFLVGLFTESPVTS